MFTGGLKYDADGVLFRDASTESITYVGVSQKVKKAWDVLLKGTSHNISPLNAMLKLRTGRWISFKRNPLDDGTTWSNYRGNYLTSYDMFHQLHCLVNNN